MSLATLQLPDHLEHAVAALHPWVYRDHLPSHRLQGGEWVRIVAGRASAVGLYDARSPIAVRVFGHKEPIIADVLLVFDDLQVKLKCYLAGVWIIWLGLMRTDFEYWSFHRVIDEA